MTTPDYSHVHEKFQHWVTCSDAERIRFIDESRWVSYPVAEKIMENLLGLMHAPKRPRMINLLIVGDSNNGKTTLIQRFYNLHGNSYINADNESVKPIILAEAPPSANEKELYISILERFFAPYRSSDSTANLRYQVIHLFREFKVSMLIIDEFQTMMIGTSRQQRIIMNAIKTLCNELKIPIVGVGTKLAIQSLHTDPQYASRFDVAELPSWELNLDYQNLLHQFEGILPLHKPSNLHRPEIASLIHTISEGNLGDAHRLLMECAKQAITTGTEQITLEVIQKNAWLKPTHGIRKVIG